MAARRHGKQSGRTSHRPGRTRRRSHPQPPSPTGANIQDSAVSALQEQASTSQPVTSEEDRSAQVNTPAENVPAIRDAIAEVQNIISTLKQVLQNMEELAELLEIAQIQRNRDLREIEELTRTLKQIQAKE